MKISRQWLQNFFDETLPSTDILAKALTFHTFEIDGIENIDGDDILDVKITPNRGHDCLSHRGIAKELSAILKIPMTRDPFSLGFDISKKTDRVTVVVEDAALCPRYLAGYITGVRVGPSPEWLQKSLTAMGQHAINNIVDATNFVMFNLGQPLHAFDAGRLGSSAIGVRLARQGEVLKALDEKEYELGGSTLVITAADRPVGIAGIKGGMADRIDETTQNIVIEAANFNSFSVRKSSQLLKLRTDASIRFEQGLSPELAGYGMRQAAKLIVELSGGAAEGFVDVYPAPQKEKRVEISVDKVNNVLGTKLTGAEVADVFSRLSFNYKEEGGKFEVVVPFERLDIEIAEDLVEEVGRIVGYDKIPEIPLPVYAEGATVNPNFYTAERVREELAAQGYSEVYTSVFAEAGEYAVLNKVDSVRPYLRESLIPGLQAAIEKNRPNKDLLGLEEIKLFEIGTVWKEGEEKIMIGTANEKEGVSEKELQPEKASAYESLPLSTARRYQPYSRYPYIVRDIAFWTTGEVKIEEIEKHIAKEAGHLAVRVYLFDRFEKPARPDDSGRAGGEGKVSLAFRLVFQSFERTLTEAEANEAMARVHAALQAQGLDIR
ncbi:phenylalanine--tRNA ligase subunit beta [Patescibacteria group bacterium]|nr:phenylalanine--tRNA ligase subunit beta [Patescibacteria group bacterium]